MKTQYLSATMIILSSLYDAEAQERAVVDSLDNHPVVRRIDEVTVTGSRSESVQMGHSVVTGQQVAMTPSLSGLPDVMTAVRTIPGVSMGREGNSAIWVRGGNRGQNLILFDGMKIYNSNHYYGLLSLFNSDVISKTDVYKGSFPASYGGRASSVIDITSIEPDSEEKHFKGSLGTLTSSLFFSTPISDRLSMYVAGRTTYYTLLKKLTMTEGEQGNYAFYDLNGKLSFRLSDNQQLSLSFFNGYDNQYFKDIYYSYKCDDWQKIHNSGVSLSHQLTSGPYLWSTTLSASDYRNTFSHDDEYLEYKNDNDISRWELVEVERSKISTRLSDITLRSSLDIDADRHQIKTGIEVTGVRSLPLRTSVKIMNRGQVEQDTTSGFFHDKRALEIGLYGSDEYKINDVLSIMAGLRLSGNVLSDTSYWGVEPRFSIRYKLSPKTSLKANYTVMKQYMHNVCQLSSSEEIDMWMPSDNKLKPETAQQVSLGLFYDGKGPLIFSTEAFYKKMNNLTDYRPIDSSILSAEEIERSLYTGGEGRSYGIEVSSKLNLDKLTFNVAYTLSRSERKFSNLNNGRWFTDYVDRTHDLFVSALWRINKKWSVSGGFNLMSGSVITVPEAHVLGNVVEYGYISELNNCRIPLYHRLDLGVHYERETRKHHRLGVSLNLYNVYCQKNATTVDVSSYDGRVWKDCIFPSIVPTLTITYTL